MRKRTKTAQGGVSAQAKADPNAMITDDAAQTSVATPGEGSSAAAGESGLKPGELEDDIERGPVTPSQTDSEGE